MLGSTMIRLAEPKIVPARQVELRQLGWLKRQRLARYAEKTRCRRCGGVRVEQVARKFGYSQQFTTRAVWGLGAFGMGLGCCCEEEDETIECAGCQDGLAPYEVQITISGVTGNGACAVNADQVNGTFVLVADGSSTACSSDVLGCKYEFSTGLTGDCNLICLSAGIDGVSLNVLRVAAVFGAFAANARWSAAFTPGSDCFAIDEALSPIGSSASINYGSSTCQMVAI